VLDESLGFGARHQHVRIHLEIERAKRRPAGDVLDRLAGEAAREPALEARRIGGIERAYAPRAQPGTGHSKQAAQQLLGVGVGRCEAA
jgi:hypothetical protein